MFVNIIDLPFLYLSGGKLTNTKADLCKQKETLVISGRTQRLLYRCRDNKSKNLGNYFLLFPRFWSSVPKNFEEYSTNLRYL